MRSSIRSRWIRHTLIVGGTRKTHHPHVHTAHQHSRCEFLSLIPLQRPRNRPAAGTVSFSTDRSDHCDPVMQPTQS